MQNLEDQQTSLKDKILLAHSVKPDFGKEISSSPSEKLSGTGNSLQPGTMDTKPCLNITQFNNSLEKPTICPTKKSTKNQDHNNLIKCSDYSCCMCLSPFDMAPVYAVEVEKLWAQQNCKNGDISQGDKKIRRIFKVKENLEQQMRDIGVITSDEFVQCPQKPLSHEIISPAPMPIDGPTVAECSNTECVIKASSMTQGSLKNLVCDKQCAAEDNMNYLVHSHQSEEGEKHLVKQNKIHSTITSENNEVAMQDAKTKSSCANKCKTVSVKAPTTTKSTVNKHSLPANKSYDKKYAAVNEAIVLPGERTSDKLCDISHKILYNVIHKLPLEARDIKSYSKFVISEGGPLNNKAGKTKQFVSEGLAMQGEKTKSSCANKCQNVGVKAPTTTKSTVKKHSFPANKSYNKKHAAVNEAIVLSGERTSDKLCDISHTILYNVIHKLPLEANDIKSYSKFLISERGPLNNKAGRTKQSVSEAHTQDTTRMTENYGTHLTKITVEDQLKKKSGMNKHPGCKVKDKSEMFGCNRHKTKQNCGIQDKKITNNKQKKLNFSPQIDSPSNRISEVHYKLDTGKAKKSGNKLNTSGSQKNSAFPLMNQHFIYNIETQNISPRFQETPQEIWTNGSDAKIRRKSCKTVGVTEELKEGRQNKHTGGAHVYGGGGIRKVTGKNYHLQHKQRNPKWDGDVTKKDKRITFANLPTTGHNTKASSEKTNLWSFLHNLLSKSPDRFQKDAGYTRKREKQPVWNKYPASTKNSHKIHKKRKVDSERNQGGTCEFQQKQLTGSTLGQNRTNVIEKRQRHNSIQKANTTTENDPSKFSKSDLKENNEMENKNCSITHPLSQDVQYAVTCNFEQPNKSISLNINKKQQKFDQTVKHCKKRSSQTNDYKSYEMNNKVQKCASTAKSKYCDQPDTHTSRKTAADFLKEGKHEQVTQNGNVKNPVLLSEETSSPKIGDNSENKTVKAGELRNPSAEFNQFIMGKLRIQRQEINSLKKQLENNEKKKNLYQMSLFTDTKVGKPQYRGVAMSEVGAPVLLGHKRNIMNYQTVSVPQNPFRLTETPTSKHVSEKKDTSPLGHDSVSDSAKYENKGQKSPLKVNKMQCNFLNNPGKCHSCTDGCNGTNNARHSHRMVDKRHKYHVPQQHRTSKTEWWNKILRVFK